MQVALRERDFDTLFMEAVPDAEQDFTQYIATAVGRIIDP